MSTFKPELHGKPDSLLIENWKGEGVRITHIFQGSDTPRFSGEVVVQGRSFGDVVRSLNQFFNVDLVARDKALLDEVWETLSDICEYDGDPKYSLDIIKTRNLMKRLKDFAEWK
jgi:hypothetical protein